MIPLKSASLILVRSRKTPITPFKFNYEILLLKRASTGTFSNVFAFPGGIYDTDKDFRSGIPNNRLESLRNTACRETLEELGLFFLPKDNSIGKSLKHLTEIKQEFKDKGLDWYSFNHLQARLKFIENEAIQPFMRLITIPILKSRYDTQFFLHRIKNDQVINWRNFYAGGLLEDSLKGWDQINFDKKEFSEMVWMDPLTAIKKYYGEKLGLAPPQYILLNIMSHFNEIEGLEAFLKKPNENEFPLMLCLRNVEDVEKREGFKYVAVGNCDEKYPVEVVSKEKDEGLKKELLESYRNSLGKGNKLRIFFKEMHKMFEKDYDVDINLQGNSLLNFLSSYREVNKRYSQI